MNPVPVVIAQLARLVSASMKQLDSAFRHPTTITGVPSTSPLIEYSHSFRTTLLQLSQRLSGVLRTANSNAGKISMLAKSSTSNIDNIQRYVARYYQNSSRLFDLISLPLNRLRKSSEENTDLAGQVVAEFEGVANLTRAVVDTVVASRQVKENHSSNTFDSMSQLEEDISSENQTIQELKKQARLHEDTFNEYLNQLLSSLENIKSQQPSNQCLEDYLKRNKSIETNWGKLYNCNISNLLSNEERSNYKKFPDVKKSWETSMNLTHLKEEELRQKREEFHKLVLAKERLIHEKQRLDKDIALLSYSVDPLETLGKDTEMLTISWKKLANLCRDIQTEVTATLETLTDSRSHVSSTELEGKLKKIHLDMDLLGKITGVYINFYNTHLADLAARLEQMMTINGADPANLEEVLVNSCKDASRMIASEIPTHN